MSIIKQRKWINWLKQAAVDDYTTKRWKSCQMRGPISLSENITERKSHYTLVYLAKAGHLRFFIYIVWLKMLYLAFP